MTAKKNHYLQIKKTSLHHHHRRRHHWKIQNMMSSAVYLLGGYVLSKLLSGGTKYKCNICPFETKSPEELKAHHILVHADEKEEEKHSTAVCKNCGFLYHRSNPHCEKCGSIEVSEYISRPPPPPRKLSRKEKRLVKKMDSFDFNVDDIPSLK